MKLFKKVIPLFVFFVFLIGNIACATEVMDVKADHWAAKEIANSIINGYLNLNEKNEFLPDGKISRTDFVSGLVRALGSENIDIFFTNELTDLSETTPNFKDIVIAEQLSIIYGYPDRTFKPQGFTTRAEATSALAHITKGVYSNLAILDRYKDKETIPAWATLSYAKAIKNGFFVNYPDKLALRPNDYLTRAEAAVLLNKVSKSLELIDSKYKEDLKTITPDVLVSTETLNVHQKPLTNVVEIYNNKKVVKAGNIIKGTFETPVNFKKAKVGDIVEFSAPEDLITEQGTFLYGAGTRFNAEILKIKKSPWREKNSKTLIVLDRISTTEGYNTEMAAVPLSKDRQFLWFKWSKLVYTNVKNPEWMPKKGKGKYSEGEFLVKYGYTVSPRVKYKNQICDQVYVLLTDDLIFRNPESKKQIDLIYSPLLNPTPKEEIVPELEEVIEQAPVQEEIIEETPVEEVIDEVTTEQEKVEEVIDDVIENEEIIEE